MAPSPADVLSGFFTPLGYLLCRNKINPLTCAVMNGAVRLIVSVAAPSSQLQKGALEAPFCTWWKSYSDAKMINACEAHGIFPPVLI